jgi:hypothetical protein
VQRALLLKPPIALSVSHAMSVGNRSAASMRVLHLQVHVTVNNNEQKCLCGGGDGCPEIPCTSVIKPAK